MRTFVDFRETSRNYPHFFPHNSAPPPLLTSDSLLHLAKKIQVGKGGKCREMVRKGGKIQPFLPPSSRLFPPFCLGLGESRSDIGNPPHNRFVPQGRRKLASRRRHRRGFAHFGPSGFYILNSGCSSSCGAILVLLTPTHKSYHTTFTCQITACKRPTRSLINTPLQRGDCAPPPTVSTVLATGLELHSPRS